MTNFDEFKRSLDSLVNQAQRTAQLGLEVAKDQVESIVKNPPAGLNEQVEEVRDNLQRMAREMETRAQELVHLATSVVAPGGSRAGTSSSSSAASAGRTTEPPSGNETATAAGAGTAQEGSNREESDITPNGEAPKQ